MVLTINPGYLLCKKSSCPVIDGLMYIDLCQLTYDVTWIFKLKYYKTNCIKLVMERKSINIDQSKVNDIL